MREKRHRLDAFHYHGSVTVGFTCCENNRRRIFATDEIFDLTTRTLQTACEKRNCIVPVFTIMPDHMHILVMGRDASSRPLLAMRYFKWRTATDSRFPDRLAEGLSRPHLQEGGSLA